MKKLSWVVFLCALFTISTAASADFTLVGSASFSGTNGVAMPITDLQITGTGTEPIPVKLLVTNGTLSMTTTTGLSFTGGPSGSTLYFSGTLANLNAALATLRYTRSGTGSDTLEVSLVPQGEVFFADNNHLYEYVSGTLDWNAALSAAAARSKYGATGYLATITSSNENAFVTARLSNAGWMGAADSAVEGAWRWVTGPENGTQFWSGLSNGSTVGGNYAAWGSGEPNDAGGEDCAQYLAGGSGLWNDLPCSGTTLPGYVVEYGAPGNLPSVVAKNISITTTNAPSVNSFSPADNATGVSTSSNLVIQFSTTVTASTSNILIYLTANNALFETISVASTTQVTGGGTNTITINPVNNFNENTGYYVMIPGTAFYSGSSYYAGTAASSTWNFTIGDFTAPVIDTISATTTSSSSATITWNTNEITSSRVVYGLTRYSTTTTETDTSPRVFAHTVVLSSLVPCSTYYYQVVSKDASANIATSSDNTFKTPGCEASTTQTSATSTDITTSAGGSTSLTEGDTGITVTAPSNFTSTSSSVVIQIQALPSAPVLGLLGRPTASANGVGDIVFDVKAIINGNTILDSFNAPVTITYQYSDADIAGLDESTLLLYHYHNEVWLPLDNCSVNQLGNVITCTAPSFSIFSLFGQPVVVNNSFIGPGAGGDSIPQRVDYLYKMGKTAEAEALKKEWPQLFADANTASTQTTTETSQVKFARDLKHGMSGTDVKMLQVWLVKENTGPAARALGKVKPTTYFGNLTKQAVIEYQKAKKITPTSGAFGPKTRKVVEGR